MRDMMPLNKALDLIRQFAELGGRRLILTGGEPLEHHGCREILACARDRRLSTTLYSMGILGQDGGPVEASFVESLSSVLDVWQVSLHSANAQGHEALTNVPGSFESTCRAVRLAVKAGIEVRATLFAYPENLLEITTVAELCGRLGIEELRVLASVAQGRAAISSSTYDLNGESLVEEVERAKRAGRTRVRLGEAAKAKHGLQNDCQAVKEELVVNWAGWVSPCHSVEPFPSSSDYDNVFCASLKDVLAKSPRLVLCRDLTRAASSGCKQGCLAREALLGSA